MNAIRFEQGLRKRNAAEPRGGDLVKRKTLQQLLDWPRDDMRPNLAIVLVDEDDDKKRHAAMRESIDELRYGRPTTVVGVARREFESWLVTDRACVAKVLDRPFDDAGDPEEWSPGEAKRLLQRMLEGVPGSDRARTRRLRCEICSRCDLEHLRWGSRSFERFLSDLEQSNS